MAKTPEKKPVNATAEEAALKPFPLRPLHPRLKEALKAASKDEASPYFRRSRNDIINLILEEKLRSIGQLGRP